MDEVFYGFVELNNDKGVMGITIQRAAPDAFDVYYWDGEGDVVRVTPAKFTELFGRKLYYSLEDYKKGNSIGAERVLI